MGHVVILTGDPIVAPIAQMELNVAGIDQLIKWVGRHRPECLPTAAEGEDSVSWKDLFPHNLEGVPRTSTIPIESFESVTRFLSANELLVELAGRKCYDSFGLKAGKKSNAEYIANTQAGDVPHASILYHAKMSFFIGGVSRRVSHELIRNYVGADRDEEGSPCLVGDTRVYGFRNTDTQTHSWALSDLYERQNTPAGRGALKRMRLRSVDATGVIVPNRILRVIDSGTKPVFRVETWSGRKITATSCHRMMTPSGWRRLGELSVGDRLTANGCPAWANKEWIEEKYIRGRMTRSEVARLAGVSDSFLGKIIRRLGIEKPLSLRKNHKPGHGRKGMHTAEGLRHLAETHRGEVNPQWRGNAVSRKGAGLRAVKMYPVTGPCWSCETTDGVERHHLDENPWNNAPDNIFFLCVPCHKAFHFEGSITVFSDEILSITSLPATRVYDVEMMDEPHNFVANGLVVHNSQESTRFTHHYGYYIAHPYLATLPEKERRHELDCFESSMGSNYDGYLDYVERRFREYEKEHNAQPKGLDRKRIYESASSYLSHACETSWIWTTNPMALAKLFKERDNDGADLEFRRLARVWKKVCLVHWPNLFPQPWMKVP